MPTGDPCRNCGDHATYYATGVGPHAAQLRCARCHRHVRWLRKSETPGEEIIRASMAAHEVKARVNQPSLFD